MAQINKIIDPEPTVSDSEGEFQNIKNITQGYVNSSTYPLQKAVKISQPVKSELNREFKDIFVPSEKQVAFLRAMFNPKTGNELHDWLEHIQIGEDYLTTWWNNPRFVEWITAEAERRMLLFRLEWLAVGIKKMHHNVSTWTTMKDLFFPKGIEHSPAEKGSKRAKLEQEVKELLLTKKSNGNKT